MAADLPNACPEPLALVESRLDDEALSRLALRDDLPTLGLTLDELLRRARIGRAVV